MKQRQSIAVDPIKCDGHGLCSELLPERITLDDWGYPIVDPTPVPLPLGRHARRAIAECPVQALKLRALPAAQGNGLQASSQPRGGER